MKKFNVPALALSCAALLFSGVPAIFAAADEPYNPVKALREANGDSKKDAPAGVLPEKKRSDAISLAVAPEYFIDFGSDLPDADGWGASIAASVIFNSDTPGWNFIGELELLAFSAESGQYTERGYSVKEELQSANLLLNLGLSRDFGKDFTLEALAGFGIGATYGEIKGENFKKSSHGNFTTTLSAKVRALYHLDENWSLFAAYRYAYISPSFASKIAGWHNLDLFPQSVELGIRYRF